MKYEKRRKKKKKRNKVEVSKKTLINNFLFLLELKFPELKPLWPEIKIGVFDKLKEMGYDA